jgi:tripartite ATP-independent transporter DctP family solute receptor
MTVNLRLIAILIVGACLLSCQQEQAEKQIKLGHALDINHPVHKAMLYMADQLAEKSGGQLTLKIYPSQQLGSERELVELLQIGSLGMTKVSSAVLGNFSPGMKIFDLPFLFEDKAHAFRTLDGEIGQSLLNQSEEYWLKGLTYYDAGSRSFYTKEVPVDGPQDLEGLKIRVQESAAAMNMIRSFGGSPTPISWGELYTALQQGVVDGAENNPPSFFLSRHYEVCKYFSIDEHTVIPDVFIISTVVWSSLTKQEQTWLKEAAEESKIYQRKLWQEAEQNALKAVKEAGVRILYPEKAPFKKEVQAMYQQYRQDPALGNILAEIDKLAYEKEN